MGQGKKKSPEEIDVYVRRIDKQGYLYLPPTFSEGDKILFEKTGHQVFLARKVDDVILKKVTTRRRIYLGDLFDGPVPVAINMVGKGLFIFKPIDVDDQL